MRNKAFVLRLDIATTSKKIHKDDKCCLKRDGPRSKHVSHQWGKR